MASRLISDNLREFSSPSHPLFGARAAVHFRQSQQLCGEAELAGLRFADLLAFCAYVEREGAALRCVEGAAVEVVFTENLGPTPAS